MKKKTLIQAATILMLIQLTAAYTIYGDNIQNIGSITGNGDFNTTGRICDGTQCLDSLDIPGQPNIDWSNITTGTNPLASDVSNLWTNATAQQAAIAALNATALANMGIYLNYTSSCAAGEVYEWGTGCITTPTGGSGSENATNLISDNPILIKPSGDTDDYLSLSTPSDQPTININGGEAVFIKGAEDTTLLLWNDDTDSFTMSIYNTTDATYPKHGRLKVSDTDANIYISPNGENQDHFVFSSDGTDLTLATTDGSKLYLSPEGKNVYIGDNADDANALRFVPAATTGYGAIGLYPGGDASPDNWMLLYLGYDNRPGMSLRTEDDADAQFIPYTDDTYNLGDATYGWDDLYVNDIINDGAITFTTDGESLTVSDGGSSPLVGTGSSTEILFADNLNPNADSTLKVGGTSQVWSEVWTDKIDSDNSVNIHGGDDVILSAVDKLGFRPDGVSAGDGVFMYASTAGTTLYPETTNEGTVGAASNYFNNIYSAAFTDTVPDAFEKELKTKNLKPLDFHITRSGETLNISYSPESVLTDDGYDTGEGGVAALLMISQLKEELCLYETKYSWCTNEGKVKLENKRSKDIFTPKKSTSSTTFSTTTTIPLTIPKTTTTLISIEEGGEEGLDGLSSGTTA